MTELKGNEYKVVPYCGRFLIKNQHGFYESSDYSNAAERANNLNENLRRMQDLYNQVSKTK